MAASSARLEAAFAEYAYGRDEAARGHLRAAAAALGLEFELGGRKAKKTQYQEDPTTVMVVEVQESDSAGAARGRGVSELTALPEGIVEQERGTHGLTGETEVYQLPKLLDASGAVLAGAALGAPEQAVLLGWTVQIRQGQAEDEMNIAEVRARRFVGLRRS